MRYVNALHYAPHSQTFHDAGDNRSSLADRSLSPASILYLSIH